MKSFVYLNSARVRLCAAVMLSCMGAWLSPAMAEASPVEIVLSCPDYDGTKGNDPNSPTNPQTDKINPWQNADERDCEIDVAVNEELDQLTIEVDMPWESGFELASSQTLPDGNWWHIAQYGDYGIFTLDDTRRDALLSVGPARDLAGTQYSLARVDFDTWEYDLAASGSVVPGNYTLKFEFMGVYEGWASPGVKQIIASTSYTTTGTGTAGTYADQIVETIEPVGTLPEAKPFALIHSEVDPEQGDFVGFTGMDSYPFNAVVRGQYQHRVYLPYFDAGTGAFVTDRNFDSAVDTPLIDGANALLEVNHGLLPSVNPGSSRYDAQSNAFVFDLGGYLSLRSTRARWRAPFSSQVTGASPAIVIPDGQVLEVLPCVQSLLPGSPEVCNTPKQTTKTTLSADDVYVYRWSTQGSPVSMPANSDTNSPNGFHYQILQIRNWLGRDLSRLEWVTQLPGDASGRQMKLRWIRPTWLQMDRVTFPAGNDDGSRNEVVRIYVSTKAAEYGAVSDLSTRAVPANIVDPAVDWVQCNAGTGRYECDATDWSRLAIDPDTIEQVRITIPSRRPAYFSTLTHGGAWPAFWLYGVANDTAVDSTGDGQAVDNSDQTNPDRSGASFGARTVLSFTVDGQPHQRSLYGGWEVEADYAAKYSDLYVTPRGGAMRTVGVGDQACFTMGGNQFYGTQLQWENEGALANIAFPFETEVTLPPVGWEYSDTNVRLLDESGWRDATGGYTVSKSGDTASVTLEADPAMTPHPDSMLYGRYQGGKPANATHGWHVVHCGEVLVGSPRTLGTTDMSNQFFADVDGDQNIDTSITDPTASDTDDYVRQFRDMSTNFYVLVEPAPSLAVSAAPTRIASMEQATYDLEIFNTGYDAATGDRLSNGATGSARESVLYQRITKAGDFTVNGDSSGSSVFVEALPGDASSIWVSTLETPTRSDASTTLVATNTEWTKCSDGATCDATALSAIGLTAADVRWVAWEMGEVLVTDAEPRGVAPISGNTRVENPYKAQLVVADSGTGAGEVVRARAELVNIDTNAIESGLGALDVVINQLPVAADDTATTDEEVAVVIDVLANDTDPEGDTLSVAGQSPQNGTLSSTTTASGDPAITYTPDPDFCGTDSFGYELEDALGGIDTATVTVTVNCVNDAPVAVDDNIDTMEDTCSTVDVLANDTDIDSTTLDAAASVDPLNGAVTYQGSGVFEYCPDPDYNGQDSFVYEVSDGDGGVASATVNITVRPVDDPPVANDDTENVQINTATSIDVLANDVDVDGDAITLSAITQAPTNGTAVIDDGGTPADPSDDTVLYTPNTSYVGSDQFVYEISNAGGIDSALVEITVAGDIPLTSDDAATTDEDTSVSIDVLANDSHAGGDSISLSTVGAPSNGTAVIDDGGTPADPTDDTISYAPSADYCGDDTFDYTIEDSDGDTATASVAITVNCVNDAPTARDDFATTAVDTLVSIDVLANDTDPEGDALSLVANTANWPGLPSNGTVSVNSGMVDYTPDAGFIGEDTFEYQVSDASGATASAVVTVQVVSTACIALPDADLAVDSDGDGWPDECDCAPGDANYNTMAQGEDGSCDSDGDGFCSADVDNGASPPVTSFEPCTGNFEDCDDADDAIYPGATEACNGVDDDCDSEVDEDFSDLADACSAGVAACQNSGEFVCSQDGSGTECSAVAGDPQSDEICDGNDNDCDGEVDEGFSLDSSCEVDFAGCAISGSTVCSASDPTTTECDISAAIDSDGDGWPDDCDCAPQDDTRYSMQAGETASCDVDGDGFCDGSIDELNAALCGDASDCDDTSSAVNPGAEEVCDETDNDCNGEVDDVSAASCEPPTPEYGARGDGLIADGCSTSAGGGVPLGGLALVVLMGGGLWLRRKRRS